MSTTKSEVATTSDAALPAMYSRPVSVGSSEERAVPIVYLMADLSRPVKNKVAEPGNIIAALDPDDTEPYFLVDEPGGTFRAFVLDGHRYVTRGGAGSPWERLDNDYIRATDGSDDDVNVGYRYAISVPGASFPLYSLLLIRSAGRSAFQKVNLALDTAFHNQATDPVMIEFGAFSTNNRQGQPYFKWSAKTAKPTEDELDAVRPIILAYQTQAEAFKARAAEPEAKSSGAGF